MHTVELRFTPRREVTTQDRDSAVWDVLASMHKNGQIVLSDCPSAWDGLSYRFFVSIPEPAALAKRHHNEYVKQALRDLADRGLTLDIVHHGHDPESNTVCRCRKRPWIVLYSSCVNAEPPLRCGACFGVVPLYRFPHTSGGEYLDILQWQADYRACDQLQLGCATGERFALRQMGDHRSSLSQRGRAICDKLTAVAKIPVFYYLYRWSGRSAKQERLRRCPSCRGHWHLPRPLFDRFDMKCDRCRLVSNEATSVRYP